MTSHDGFVELLAPLGEQADGKRVHHEVVGGGGFGSCVKEWPSYGTARPAGSIG